MKVGGAGQSDYLARHRETTAVTRDSRRRTGMKDERLFIEVIEEEGEKRGLSY